jgi:hypothetical protein
MSLQQCHSVGIQGATPEIEPCSERCTATSTAKVAPAPSKEEHVTISQRQKLLWHTVEDQQINPVTPIPNSISPEMRASLKCLGMTDGALLSWHTFHVSPIRAMLYFFISVSMMIASLAYLQYGAPLNFLYIRVPCICAIVVLTGYGGAIWRYGPAAAKSRVYIMTLPVSWASMAMAFFVRWAPHACPS